MLGGVGGFEDACVGRDEEREHQRDDEGVQLVVVVELAELAFVEVDHVFVQDVFQLVRAELALAQVVFLRHLYRAVVQQQLQLRVVEVQRLLEDHRVFRVVVVALVADDHLLVDLVDLVSSSYVHEAVFGGDVEVLLDRYAVDRWVLRSERQTRQLAGEQRRDW